MEAFRSEGLSSRRAVEATLQQVSDWRDLQHRIAIAKTGGLPMRKRIQQLWVPGFITFALSTIFLVMLQTHQFQPYIASWTGAYVQWLLSLSCLGASGTYLSYRAGASRRRMPLACTFPVLGLATALVLMFPIGLFLGRIVSWPVDFRLVATGFLTAPLGSLLLPAAALLIGGLPIALFLPRALTERGETVIN
jgi:hypothetical protein